MRYIGYFYMCIPCISKTMLKPPVRLKTMPTPLALMRSQYCKTLSECVCYGIEVDTCSHKPVTCIVISTLNVIYWIHYDPNAICDGKTVT